MKYYIIAGEASGDLHASNLMKALRAEDSAADFRFYGGDKMQAVGGTLVRHYRDLAYMGFIPVVMHLRTILSNMSRCKKDIVAWNPDVVILVDYPGFNLSIAEYISANTSIPVYYYISPKIWAWKEYRIKTIRKCVSEMFSILPFEVDFYRRHDYPIHYVGNPCVDAVQEYLDKSASDTFTDFTRSNGLSSKPVIALLAGSRKQEIKDNLPQMIEAASAFRDYQLVVAGAPGIDKDYYGQFIPEGADVKLVFGQTYRILRHSTAALVTSGTATLETAILSVPQVVCYYIRAGKLISFLRKLFLHVPYISLVNLILNKEAVTELVADRMNVDNLRSELKMILPGGSRLDGMRVDYSALHKILGPAGASTKAARIMVKLLTERNKTKK